MPPPVRSAVAVATPRQRKSRSLADDMIMHRQASSLSVPPVERALTVATQRQRKSKSLSDEMFIERSPMSDLLHQPAPVVTKGSRPGDNQPDPCAKRFVRTTSKVKKCAGCGNANLSLRSCWECKKVECKDCRFWCTLCPKRKQYTICEDCNATGKFLWQNKKIWCCDECRRWMNYWGIHLATLDVLYIGQHPCLRLC